MARGTSRQTEYERERGEAHSQKIRSVWIEGLSVMMIKKCEGRRGRKID